MISKQLPASANTKYSPGLVDKAGEWKIYRLHFQDSL
jgi:hypothetical protein